MRTLICEYDLCHPQDCLWLRPGYRQALILIRRGRQLLGTARCEIEEWQVALRRDQVEALIAERLGEAAARPPSAPPGAEDFPRPPISVVVCTRDRAAALARCLAALAALDYPNYEVVVVDNASRDGATAEAVAATPFRYVREERPGLDWARNRGAAEARHDIVAYIDDDALADRAWLQGLAAGFADPRVAVVTGQVLPAEVETPAQVLFERYGGMGKGPRGRVFRRDNMTAYEMLAAHDLGVGTNMALRREVLAKVGGFDTALDVGTPAGGGGDVDLFYRVLAAGLAARYEPGALVWHQHRRSMDDLKRQLYNNGRAFGMYLMKRFREADAARRAVLGYGLRWWVSDWLIGRLIRRRIGREPFPPSLTLAEVRGALSAPWAWHAASRQDRRVRSQM